MIDNSVVQAYELRNQILTLQSEGNGLLNARNTYAKDISNLIHDGRDFANDDEAQHYMQEADLIPKLDSRIGSISSELTDLLKKYDVVANQYFEGVDLSPADFHDADLRATSNHTAEAQEARAQVAAAYAFVREQNFWTATFLVGALYITYSHFKRRRT